MNYDPSKPLLFQHIPKCAGTSVLKVFRSWFGERLWTHYYNNETSEPPLRLSPTEVSGGEDGPRCLFGHFSNGRGTGIEEYYPDVEQIVTIIRDPFGHAVSKYFFARDRAEKGRPNRLGGIIRERNLPLDAYLQEFGCYYGDFLPRQLSQSNYKELLREKYLFIGITERLDESMESVACMLGKPKLAVPRKNVVERNVCYDRETLRPAFAERNWFMMNVYRECCVIFEERRRRTFRERIFKGISRFGSRTDGAENS